MTPFVPAGAATVNIAATTSSANAQVLAGAGLAQFRIVNAGPSLAFVKLSSAASPTATTSDIPVPAGTIEVMSHPAPIYAAAITASGSATLYFTPGEGF